MRMIKIICVQTILSLLMIGCNHLEDRDVSFTVFYYNGIVEFSISPTPNEFKMMCEQSSYSDTIYIDSDSWQSITSGIQSMVEPSDSSLAFNPHLLIIIDGITICLNPFNNECMVSHDGMNYYRATMDNLTAYNIKWKSGFYNYICKEDLLDFDDGIREFGIPIDYSPIHGEWNYLPPITSKIMLISKKY